MTCGVFSVLVPSLYKLKIKSAYREERNGAQSSLIWETRYTVLRDKPGNTSQVLQFRWCLLALYTTGYMFRK